MDVDTEHLKTWIGRTEEVSDHLSVRLADAFAATLDQERTYALGDEAPLCLHWCLAPPTVPQRATGPDGHPARGGFLPPVPLPRRMWAGGALTFRAPLAIGDVVTRRSTITDVALKVGRTGPLCFVTVDHEIVTARGTAIEERQDIVYREMAPTPLPPAPTEPGPAADASETVAATPLLLFRYSALTFNGHRIHYDRPYATEEEGYPGLVVHGPLQATLLAQLAARTLGGITQMDYRGVGPLFDGDRFTVNVARTEAGLDAWTAAENGRATMKATVR
ncbi:MaoC family dehydratase N-terminal domain-containing protein [Acuticoccus sp. I52.16.1]|uniref:FAS1-like dehydratase domain-containing protein n=1 Tax=Acuticoccus sp. I52.16.1 TaxID=2928472 RepID=UPI001FD15A07|nr:MaoC family dehydratase N-terminal domain-containing protein [Acuticoccus sp. I52.16.1]UOM32929.1 MaoC family dehydratase N-terminal domain-containing protein [Acuticoccus sp. I52.16.1]